MDERKIPDDSLVVFKDLDGSLLPGIVINETCSPDLYNVAFPPRYNTVLRGGDSLLVISPMTYNFLVDKLDRKDIDHVNESAYIQHDTLHPGDGVILMSDSSAAVVQEVVCENGEYKYYLTSVYGKSIDCKFRRHELLKVGNREYCKHLKWSKSYLDYLETIYKQNMEETSTSVYHPGVLVLDKQDGIPGIIMSSTCDRLKLILKADTTRVTRDISSLRVITCDLFASLVFMANKTGSNLKTLSQILSTLSSDDVKHLSANIKEFLNTKEQENNVTNPKYKVGDMVFWHYCTINENAIPAYVEKVKWDELRKCWSYHLILANECEQPEIAEYSIYPCKSVDEFNEVVEQTNDISCNEVWKYWDHLVDLATGKKVVCNSCGAVINKEDSRHCDYWGQTYCSACWGNHASHEEEDDEEDEEEEDTVECDGCGEEMNESDANVCPNCGSTLCDECNLLHNCSDEDEEEEDEDDEPEPKPEITAEEAVRKWMGKA